MMVNLAISIYYKDTSESCQVHFPDSGSPISEQLSFFHDNIMFFLLLIVMIVSWMMTSSVCNKFYYKYFFCMRFGISSPNHYTINVTL